MIESHELKRRDIYLNKLIGFRDTEPVKVVTGSPLRQIQPAEADDSAFERYGRSAGADNRNEL